MSPWVWFGLGILPGLWVLWDMLFPHKQSSTVLALGRFSWSYGEICGGWLITGRTRSGKTAAGICNILAQLFENIPDWGGLCIDDKGLFWEVLVNIARHYHAQDRLVLLQVRPEFASGSWQPLYKYNLLSDPRVPASLYAKTIVDVGGSLGGGSGMDFFKTAAQIHIEKALEACRQVGVCVTLTNIYHMLSDPQDMADILWNSSA